MSFITVLENQGVPTTTMLTAVTYLQDRDDLTDEEYRIRIVELTGLGDDIECGVVAKYTYLYTIQEAMRAYGKEQKPVNMAEMYNQASTLVVKFLADRPHLLTPPVAESVVDAITGVVKKKRGAKKEQTCALWSERQKDNLTRQEWIALLQSEVGLTKAGASTYYAKLKNGTFGC